MKKIVTALLLASFLFPAFSSCSGQPESQTDSFFLMDTVITITLYTADKDSAARQFALCRELLTELDMLWSRQRTDSEIARLNASDGGISGSDPRTIALIMQAQEICAATNGAFDITLAGLSDLWQTCGAENRLPAPEELAMHLALTGTALLHVTGDTVTKPEGIQIDLGAIGKGAAISLLIGQLETSGIPGGLISFGSNVAVFGSKPDKTPFRIALRNPKNPSGTIGSLALSAGSVLSVSGDYERYVTINGQTYHHILNPETGYPADSGLSSVAVICRDGALADALSTALFVMGMDAALEFYNTGIYGFEAIFITSAGNVILTPGMTDFQQN